MKINIKNGWLWIAVLIISIIFLILFWVFIFGIYSSQKGSNFNKGQNAVWIGHEWAGENKTFEDISLMIENFQKYQIKTVFVHVGPLNGDGTIDHETYKYSFNFLEKARKIDPDIKFQAWLGQIRNKIDLGDEKIRHNVVKQAMIMIQFVGFDGVHFDIEPVSDDDLDFIELLKETREILPAEKLISVALAELIPNSLIWMTRNFHEYKNYNTELNYTNVAKYADQIVTMAYDTGIKQGWLYKRLVEEQLIRLTNILDGKEIFVAIPAYDEAKNGFDPRVENVENGLEGIIAGLNNVRSEEQNFTGVAIYPYWKIDQREWKIYEDLWLK